MELRRGTNRSRSLRLRQTDAESLLWTRLRASRLCGFKFRRQVPVSGYVVDFVCIVASAIVEIDGGQHGDRIEFDAARSAVLAKSGFRVLPFWNNEVQQRLDDVLAEILRQPQAPPSPQPSPASGRGAKSTLWLQSATI